MKENQNTQNEISTLKQKAALPENLPVTENSQLKSNQQKIETQPNAPQQKTRIRRRYEN